jgi:hypothetical protein
MTFQIKEAGSKIATTVSTSERVFDLIFKITGDEPTAIEVASWSELASIGEIYETDTFLVKVVE